MSTRSRTGILHADGSTDTIYCHSDGYPEHQMPILREHYNTTEKVRELLSLGDLSLLGERIAPEPDEEHGMSHRAENVTIAYHRDANEPLTPPRRDPSISAMHDCDWDIDWFYLFDPNSGNWLNPIKHNSNK